MRYEPSIQLVKAAKKAALRAINFAKLDGINDLPGIENATDPDFVPSKDIPAGKSTHLYNFTNKNLTNTLTGFVAAMFPDYNPVVSGEFYYPKSGYMSWHTNSDTPQTRVYITYADEPQKSFFRYIQDGVVHTDWDDEGITVRVFETIAEPPYFWHCIGSQCNRVSFGFRLSPK